MNAEQLNEITSHRATIAVLTAHPEATGSPAVQATIAELVQRLENIDREALVQQQPVSVKTALRKEAFAAAHAAAVVIGGRALSYANRQGLLDLAAVVNVSALRMPRLRLLARLMMLQRLHDAVVPKLAELATYEVDAALLANLQEKIDRATEAFTDTRIATVRRGCATNKIKQELVAVKRFLAERLDPLIAALGATHPAFYRKYRYARHVIQRPGAPASTAAPPATSATAPTQTPAAQNLNPLAA